MIKVLVSACLMGEQVKYHGGDAKCDHPQLAAWEKEGRLVRVCPEVSGGFSTPRAPSEIEPGENAKAVFEGSARILNNQSEDVTDGYLKGARMTASLAEDQGVRIAILKENSPSCGAEAVYDGTFSGRKIPGEGITAFALKEKGIQVFNEDSIDQAREVLEKLES